MAAHEEERPKPFVTIEGGGLEGVYLESRGGGSYVAFLGIPYADPPERFEPSTPATPWTGVRDASTYGPECSQWDRKLRTTIGSEENGLTINVFVPAEHFNSRFTTDYESVSSRLGRKILGYVWPKLEASLAPAMVTLPVLVYIHGERFQFGSSSEYGAEYIMDEGVLFVTFNYRMGALGFLSTGDEVIPGNLGLKDQNLALKWIHKHIHAFGGDAKSITLYGQAAGSASVSLHLVSLQSRGLFQKAICSSGTCFDDWVFQENPKANAAELVRLLNGQPMSSDEMKIFLKSCSVKDICRATQDKNPLQNPWMVPVMETNGVSNPFLAESPRLKYSTGDFAKVPLLVTANAEEGLAFKSCQIMKTVEFITEINGHWYEAAPHLYNYGHLSEDAKRRVSEDILMFYFNNKQPILTNASFNSFTNSFTDLLFTFGTRELGIMHAVHSTTFAAILDIKGNWSTIQNIGYSKPLGMAHTDDLQYVFNSARYPKFQPDSNNLLASQRLVRMLANFVKFGDPSYEPGRKHWLPIEQGEIVSRDLNWMYIKNHDYEQDKMILHKRMKFADQFYQTVGMV